MVKLRKKIALKWLCNHGTALLLQTADKRSCVTRPLVRRSTATVFLRDLLSSNRGKHRLLPVWETEGRKRISQKILVSRPVRGSRFKKFWRAAFLCTMTPHYLLIFSLQRNILLACEFCCSGTQPYSSFVNIFEYWNCLRLKIGYCRTVADFEKMLAFTISDV